MPKSTHRKNGRRRRSRKEKPPLSPHGIFSSTAFFPMAQDEEEGGEKLPLSSRHFLPMKEKEEEK
jgi:hypothetical protein